MGFSMGVHHGVKHRGHFVEVLGVPRAGSWVHGHSRSIEEGHDGQVGHTCGEGFEFPHGWGHSQDGGQDVGVGDEDGQVGDKEVEANHNEHQNLIDGVVRARDGVKRGGLAIKVVDDAGTTEGEPKCKPRADSGIHDPSKVRASYQQSTNSAGHGDDIEQWAADGHVAVICHHSQEVALGGGKDRIEIKLCEARGVRNDLPFC